MVVFLYVKFDILCIWNTLDFHIIQYYDIDFNTDVILRASILNMSISGNTFVSISGNVSSVGNILRIEVTRNDAVVVP